MLNKIMPIYYLTKKFITLWGCFLFIIYNNNSNKHYSDIYRNNQTNVMEYCSWISCLMLKC